MNVSDCTFALLLSKKEWLTRKNLLFSPCFWQSFTAFSPFYDHERLLPSLFNPVDLLKEWLALRKEWIASLLTQNKWFAEKSKERISNPGFFCIFFSCAHHIDDLLQGYPKGEHESLWLVEYGPVEGVVVGEEGAQQTLLLRTPRRVWQQI